MESRTESVGVGVPAEEAARAGLPPGRSRRRRIVVDPRLQFGLLGMVLMQMGIFLISLVLVLFGPPFLAIHRNAVDSFEAVRAADQIIFLDARFWPAVLASFALTALVVVKTSHRIAGPLVRFRGAWDAVAAGRLPVRLRLRRGDYLRREERSLNEMIDRLTAHARELDETRAILEEAATHLARAPESRELARRLEEVRQRLGFLERGS